MICSKKQEMSLHAIDVFRWRGNLHDYPGDCHGDKTASQ